MSGVLCWVWVGKALHLGSLDTSLILLLGQMGSAAVWNSKSLETNPSEETEHAWTRYPRSCSKPWAIIKKRQTVHLLAPHQYHLKSHSEDSLAVQLMHLISLCSWMDINNCAALAFPTPSTPARQILLSFPRFGFKMQTPFMVPDCSKGQAYSIP